MAKQARPRPEGETTGSAQRPAQHLTGRALDFDLGAEVERLHEEPAWGQGDRNAKTLVKQPDFRVVLTAMKAGARLAQHEAAGRITIHALEGRLRVHLPDASSDLPAGRLLALDRGVPHDVEAINESAFLLTVSWPGEERGR